jgi:hypothetical protein
MNCCGNKTTIIINLQNAIWLASLSVDSVSKVGYHSLQLCYLLSVYLSFLTLLELRTSHSVERDEKMMTRGERMRNCKHETVVACFSVS